MGGYLPCTDLLLKNNMENIPRLTPREKFYTDHLGKSRPLMLLPDTKRIAVIKKLIYKY